MKLKPTIVKKARAIRALYEEMAAVSPSGAGKIRLDPPLSEEAISALMEKLPVNLPDELIALSTLVGDGGTSFCGELPALDELFGPTPERVTRPFPLEKAWFSPLEHDPENPSETGLPRKAVRFIYPLPEGVRHDDGTVTIGATGDHSLYVLVVNGPDHQLGKVWVDATSQDGGGVLPSHRTREFAIDTRPVGLLDLTMAWAKARLAELTEAAARKQALVDAVRNAADPEAALDGFPFRAEEIWEWQRQEEAFDPAAMRVAALVNQQAVGDNPKDEDQPMTGLFYGFGGHHEEMLEASSAQVERARDVGENRTHPGDTAVTHLRLAAALLGRLDDVEPVRYKRPSEYYHWNRGGHLQRFLRQQPPEIVPGLLEVIAPEVAARVLAHGFQWSNEEQIVETTMEWLSTFENLGDVLLRQTRRMLLRAVNGWYVYPNGAPKLPGAFEHYLTDLPDPALEAKLISPAVREQLLGLFDRIRAAAKGEVDGLETEIPERWW